MRESRTYGSVPGGPATGIPTATAKLFPTPKFSAPSQGTALLAGTASHEEFMDLVVSFHNSAFETSFRVFRRDDIEYKRIDCYVATLNPESPIFS